jgi:hypothetical protein
LVYLNEKLQREAAYYQIELKRLREILLDPRKPYDRLDDKNTSDKFKAVGDDYALLWTKVPQF